MKTLLMAMLLASSAYAGETVLETSVYFDTGNSNLSSETKIILDKVAWAIRSSDVVVAVGNTDARPFKASNNKLGLARANAVKAYLAILGVPVDAISTTTLGETKARATKKSGALALSRDRRVDITVTRTLPSSSTPVIVERVVEKKVLCPVVVPVAPASKPDSWYRLMGHVALGVGARVPHWSGLLGLRVAFPKVHLGTEVYTPFQYGLGFQGLVYPIETKNVNWHLNLGILGLGKSFLSTQDVPRTWDVTAGTGVEIKLVRHLSLAIDWRVSVPSPVFIATHANPVYSSGAQVTGDAGRYLDVKNVLGNSVTQSQLLVGVLFY